jgi:hypothetical protein
MIKKTTLPIIEDIDGKKMVTELIIEYRLFGILLYQKKSTSPEKYGVTEYYLLNT